MKASDYIVNFLAERGIDHIFGYQGTMIAHLVDSIYKSDKITNHICYNEQGAAFAAVGYAKATGRVAAAYATSGPGAINLLSGVADAYYDSVPVIFITGQLNTYEYTDIPELRQQGFQEANVVAAAEPFSKYAVQVTRKEDLRYELEKAFAIALEGRKGPCLLDIPMNLQREEIEPESLRGYEEREADEEACRLKKASEAAQEIYKELMEAKRPMILIGNGIVKGSETHKELLKLLEKLQLPVITSLLGSQLLDSDNPLNFGFLGAAYGHRYTNLLAHKKADLIVSLGCSVCKRQTGTNSKNFAREARFIRVDVDEIELRRKVHEDDLCYAMDAGLVIKELNRLVDKEEIAKASWLQVCKIIREKLSAFDRSCEEREPNRYIEAISSLTPPEAVIAVDVGQHMMWLGQSFKIRGDQRVIYSGGHGAMGFSLPAAIGAHYGRGKEVVVVSGDGSLQMNIQELQWLKRENIPAVVFVLNNSSLGLIHQQQDDFFGGLHYGSTEGGGYTVPNFSEVAKAYGINSFRVETPEEILALKDKLTFKEPALIEVMIKEDSKAYPKTYFGEEMHNQKPYVDKELLRELLEL